MTTIQFKIRDYDYAKHPWFGKTNLFSHLKREDIVHTVPLFSRQQIYHTSHSEFLDRKQLARVLQKYNEYVGNLLEDTTIRSIETDGRFILTGHQPILLTGPMFIFFKAVSVISLCHSLQQYSETRLLPGIWIATEDHDVLEVNRCEINGLQFVYDYQGEITTNQMPQVGEINLKGCREPLLKFLNDALPHNDFHEWILDMVSSCSFEDYGQLFASLIHRIFKDWLIILIDPIALRPLSSLALASIVEQWDDIEKAFESGKKMVCSYGFSPNLSALNIFEIVDGKRVKCPVTNHGFTFSTGIKDFCSAAEDIRSRPMAFSSGAALRPVIQDSVIPVTVYVGGPAELLYSWQITKLYDILHITRSKLLPRISATILENNIKKAAAHSGLYPAKIFYVDKYLKNYKPDTAILDDVEGIDGRGQELLNYIEQFTTKQNKKWLEKTTKSIKYNLNKLKDRLAEERLREFGLGRRNLEKVYRAVLPSGKPQERTISIFQFLGDYGPDFISLSVEKLDPEKLCHQIVEIEPIP